MPIPQRKTVIFSTGPASTAGDPPGSNGHPHEQIDTGGGDPLGSTGGPGVARRFSDRMVISTPGVMVSVDGTMV